MARCIDATAIPVYNVERSIAFSQTSDHEALFTEYVVCFWTISDPIYTLHSPPFQRASY